MSGYYYHFMTLLRTGEYVSDMLGFPDNHGSWDLPKDMAPLLSFGIQFLISLPSFQGRYYVMMYTLQPHSNIPFPHSIITI